jgi:hypothetical protein
LGRRLREAEEVSDEDRALLQSLLLAHNEAMSEVAAKLREIGLEPTTRVKTYSTIIDKLRREHGMHLSRVHDLAGARIVKHMTLTEQSRLCDEILRIWPEADLVDRRANPSYGYRAVHVIPRIERCFVEIQVRTFYQDSWAQATETLADHWGRAIRYGGLPDEPEAATSGEHTRKDTVDVWIEYYSPRIAELERQEDFRERMCDSMEPQELAELDNEMEADFGDLRRFLRELHDIVYGTE